MMTSSSRTRRHGTPLLARPPCGPPTYEEAWSTLIVDTTEQLEALADLLARGLLSPAEFEQQKAKVIGPSPRSPGSPSDRA